MSRFLQLRYGSPNWCHIRLLTGVREKCIVKLIYLKNCLLSHEIAQMLILFSDALPDAYPSAEKRPSVTYIKSSQQEHPNSTVHFIDRIPFANKSDAFGKPGNNNASKDFFFSNSSSVRNFCISSLPSSIGPEVCSSDLLTVILQLYGLRFF